MTELAALPPQGSPLSLDDITLSDQFNRIPMRTPLTAKVAERVQLQGIAHVATDMELRTPLSQRPCLAYCAAVRTPGARKRESVCAKFSMRIAGVQLDVDPTHMLLVFADNQCTRLVAPAADLQVLRDRLGFSAKPSRLGPVPYEYFEGVFAVAATVRLIGFIRAPDHASATDGPFRQSVRNHVMYGTAKIPLLMAAG
jgi:hypothetical protein